MEDLKQQHLDFIKANPFALETSFHGFSEEEVIFLETYGHWLDALFKGKLKANSESQKEFIAEMKTKKQWHECQDKHASLWKKYLRKKIVEEDVHDVMSRQYKAEDDPFGSREEFQAMHKGQFKTITQQHRS